MPLSKAKMRERKRQDRAKVRFDTLKKSLDVKPKSPQHDPGPAVYDLDADGNPIYDE